MSISYIKPDQRRRVIAEGREGVLYDEYVVDTDAAEETKIQNILTKYRETGSLPQMRKQVFGVMPGTETLAQAMELVRGAETMFAQLPAATRELMGNDVRNYEAFVSDPRNREAMEYAGISTAHLPDTVPTAGEAVVPSPGGPPPANMDNPTPPVASDPGVPTQ